jgi:hypothetical protein
MGPLKVVAALMTFMRYRASKFLSVQWWDKDDVRDEIDQR